jgi:S1-C subfamily serine protease
VKGYRIEAIDENKVEFISKDNKTKCSITFPHPEMAATAPAKPKKAHFGLLVHVLDPVYAAKMKIKQKMGLFVLKSRPGVNVYKGDIITKISGKKIHSIKDALGIMEKHHAGDSVEMELIRKGKKLKTEFKFN